jgi:hypothetical protein
LYKPGEDCLLFASRLKNGDYETFDYIYGKYLINGNKVIAWQLMSVDGLPVMQVIDQIKKYL